MELYVTQMWDVVIEKRKWTGNASDRDDNDWMDVWCEIKGINYLALNLGSD